MGCFPSRKLRVMKNGKKANDSVFNSRDIKIQINSTNFNNDCSNIIIKNNNKSQKNHYTSYDNNKNLDSKYLNINIKSDKESSRSNISSIKDFKVTNGLMVQNVGDDPFKFYDKLKVLGEGSFGTVFKVMHKTTKFIRAMKVIDKKTAALSDENEKNLINEINIVKSLDHPNIIKVYEYFNTKRRLFIVTELCTGGELFQKIQKERVFSESLAAHVMKQILSAVCYCHANKIIHRDLKPENILIESEKEATKEYFQVKIIDFGTSDVFSNTNMLTKQIGTPYYIAPEILNNSYNEKSDLWSCGVILYIMLSGNPPFLAEEDEQIYKLVRKGNYDISGGDWSLKSNEAKDLIKNLLVKDISKRYSAEQALNHQWFSIMGNKIKQKLNIRLNTNKSDEKILGLAQNLKIYDNANKKLQQATLAYIVHNMVKKEETEEFRKLFMEFDANGDGHLTKDELVAGLSKAMGSEEAKKEVERVMEYIDVDGNGFIEYEEFLRAAMKKEKILTQENLKTVFDLFDKDKSGKISIAEIREVLGADMEISDNIWTEIVAEIGISHNTEEEISFKQFKEMMDKLIDNQNLVKQTKLILKDNLCFT